MQDSKRPLFSGLTGFGTLRPAMGAIESKEEIGKRLAQTRLALGFESQVDFIKTLGGGLTLQRWNNWERGRDRIPVEWAITIARRHRVTLDWIYIADRNLLPGRLLKALDELETAPHKDSPKKPKRATAA